MDLNILWSLYAHMLQCRRFEAAVTQLWNEGHISGEMHLGTGEEAIVAGVLAHLKDDDALALDHRGTPPLIMRGVDPVLILKELLGRPDGLCAGQGGHMHLFSKAHLAASSGIVGAAGPTAAGFALAAQYLRPGTISVAFFGEGSLNQGMLLEAMNLAAAWQLPVLFVCKDDDWSITTPSDSATGGSLGDRARSLGLTAFNVDGRDVVQVWRVAQEAVNLARSGEPVFLHAQCIHLEGHFLGYQLLRIIRNPIRELPKIAIPLLRSFFSRNGAPIKERIHGLKIVLTAIYETRRDPREQPSNDPILRVREKLKPNPSRLAELEKNIDNEIKAIITQALQGVAS